MEGENELVGRSESHLDILRTLRKVAATDAEVLITGPSGVGKELYARFVHDHSRRRDGEFVPINCASLSVELLENELFGHVGGAFTGARSNRKGLVDEANGGTLFLDEVDSLSIPCQIKLLRFLQDKRYRRLGENYLRKSSTRIVAATNTDLVRATRERHFRQDLFYRLRVVPVEILALRQRPEDISELLAYFTKKCAEKYDLPAIDFSEEAMQRLRAYSWPGNVRELENCVRYLTCMQLGREIEPGDLPLLDDAAGCEGDPCDPDGVPQGDPSFQKAKNRLVSDFEQTYLRHVLERTSGNVSAAARLSGKNRRALFELIRKHSIDPGDYRVAPP